MFKVGKFTITWEKTPSKAKAVASKIASLSKKTSKKIAVWFSARISSKRFANMPEEKQEKVLENLKTYAAEKSESMLKKDASLGSQRDEYAANLNRIDSLEFDKETGALSSDELESKIEELKNRNEKIEQEFEQKRQEYEQSIIDEKYEPLKEIYDEIQQTSILPEETKEEFELPKKIYGDLNLKSLKSEENFELPKKIYGDLNLELKSTEEMTAPEVEEFVDYTVADAKKYYEEEQQAKANEESFEDKTKKYIGIDLNTVTKPVSLENFMKKENNKANESISDVLVNLVQACATLYDNEYKDRIIEIIKTCNDKIEEERKINSSLSANLSETNTELKKAQEDNKDLSEKNNTLLQENSRLEKSNNSRSETIKQQYEEIASKDEIIKKLNEDLATAKNMYETEHSLNDSLRDERESLNKEIDVLRKRTDDLKKQTNILMESNSMKNSTLDTSEKIDLLTQTRDKLVSQSERLATKEELESLKGISNGNSEVHQVNFSNEVKKEQHVKSL